MALRYYMDVHVPSAISRGLMRRGVDVHAHTCAACAEICLHCAESCDDFGSDPRMSHCADVCRRCAESCRSMAA